MISTKFVGFLCAALLQALTQAGLAPSPGIPSPAPCFADTNGNGLPAPCFSTTTPKNPAPDSTSYFERITITEVEGCANFCNTPLVRIDQLLSECTCDEKCAESDKYGTCCDYADVCMDTNSTLPLTTTTVTTVTTQMTTEAISTKALSTVGCKPVCTVQEKTCDELQVTCSALEIEFGCDCSGCDCTFVDTTEPATPQVTTDITTEAMSTAAPSTRAATTTSTTTPYESTATPCPPTCFGLSCDALVPFGGAAVNTRCLALESQHGCDCTGCACNETMYATVTGTTTPGETTTTTTTSTTTQLPDLNFGIDTSVIGGGFSNTATGKYAVIGGGRANMNTQEFVVTAGGVRNTLRSNYATVGGGYVNTVTGRFGSIAGGRANAVGGRHSVILGSKASTVGKDIDNILVLNFNDEKTTIDEPNTIALNADDIHVNDIDIAGAVARARRLSKVAEAVDAEIEEKLSILGALKLEFESKTSLLTKMLGSTTPQ